MAWMRQSKPEADPPRSNPDQGTQAAQAAPPQQRETQMERMVNIGKSIQIKGELTGNEDLVIEGQVDGKIILKDHVLTVGANGHITAEVKAKSVVVVGEVVGNITADDRVEVAATGSMNGDIAAPRVVLADGARFKGSIDMEPKGGSAKMGVSQAKPAGSGMTTGSPVVPQSAGAAK
jgi:cytoskeletal protein CcmA (bactofilin family)